MSESVTTAVWRYSKPVEVQEWLRSLSVPWWIAGGWALDLFLGEETRPHEDIDVGILRKDALNVRASLPEWEFFEAREGLLTRLAADMVPRRAVNSLWSRRVKKCEWELELMLDEGGGDAWVFRRNAKIERSLDGAIRHSADGIPYLAPEIQLLYKSQAIRSKDQFDFDTVVDRLDKDARAWLRRSLAIMDGSHAWLSKL
jgi:Aminoglycoside-2''-adenylyltransferase